MGNINKSFWKPKQILWETQKSFEKSKQIVLPHIQFICETQINRLGYYLVLLYYYNPNIIITQTSSLGNRDKLFGKPEKSFEKSKQSVLSPKQVLGYNPKQVI
jgi:hypothetical protein